MVKVGDLLRLHFLVIANNYTDNELPRAERMWVEVCGILNSAVFRGYLTNEPNVIQSLNPGDVIEFSWRHAAQVFVKKNDPRHPDYSGSDR